MKNRYHKVSEFYKECLFELEYLGYISYLFHMKYCSWNNETKQYIWEFDGIHPSQEQLKSFGTFLITMRSYDDRSTIMLIAENNVPFYITDRLREVMATQVSWVSDFFEKYEKLNQSSKLYLADIHDKLEKQNKIISDKLHEIEQCKEYFISFF